jgi:hypothetical protein
VLVDFASGRSVAKNAALKKLSYDVVYLAPASSVQVEKLHANTQLGNPHERHAGRKPKTLHQNTYVMSAYLEHRRIKKYVEKEQFGQNKTRASALLRKRVVSSTTTKCDVRSVLGGRQQNSFLKGVLKLA